MSKVFLIPGLGADCRLYKNIDLDGYEVVNANWIEPDLNDTLTTYAQKIIKQYDIKDNDIVIGNSMGGIVAIEIAKQINLKKTILISSIKTDSEAPGYFSFFRAVPLYKFIPGTILSSPGKLIKPLFGNISIRNAELFADMLSHTSPVFTKWAMGAILNWRNTVVPPNVYHITGDNDLIFPVRNIKNAQIVKNGTHLMIFNKAKQLNMLLKDILAE